jgi:hypothetical protein
VNSSQRAALATASILLGAVLSQLALDLYSAHHRPPTSVSTPDQVPPPGWAEVCDSAAIGFVCHTYPPGDERWQPTAPVPPQPPLPTPWPGGESAR